MGGLDLCYSTTLFSLTVSQAAGLVWCVWAESLSGCSSSLFPIRWLERDFASENSCLGPPTFLSYTTIITSPATCVFPCVDQIGRCRVLMSSRPRLDADYYLPFFFLHNLYYCFLHSYMLYYLKDHLHVKRVNMGFTIPTPVLYSLGPDKLNDKIKNETIWVNLITYIPILWMMSKNSF